MVIIILEFLFFALVGWILDSGYRSIKTGHLVNAGFFRGPFCPIYGIAGVVLLFFLKSLSDLYRPLLILLATLLMVMVEYFGGLFSEKVLQIKLWDYSQSRFHVGGYIDFLHSFYWLVLVFIFYLFAFPTVLYLENRLIFPKFLDLPALLFFIFIFAWLTISKVPARFLEFKDQVLNLSVEDYQHLVADIKKLCHVKSEEVKRALTERIKKRLENSGGKLKERD